MRDFGQPAAWDSLLQAAVLAAGNGAPSRHHAPACLSKDTPGTGCWGAVGHPVVVRVNFWVVAAVPRVALNVML